MGITISKNDNSIDITTNTDSLIIANNVSGETITVDAEKTSVVTVGTPGARGSQGEEGPVGSFSAGDDLNIGNLTASANISSSGIFTGDGSGLTNIQASGITGLNLSRVASGSFTASIAPDKGFEVNTNITASGNISASGDLIASSSLTLNAATSSIFYDEKLRIEGNSDEAIQMNNNSIKFIIGGSEAMVLRDSNDDIMIGYGGIDQVIIGSGAYSMYTADMTTQTNAFKYKSYFHQGGLVGMPNTGATITVSGSSNFLGNVTASGNISASGTITVGHIEASTINTTEITSSIVTSSIIYSSGSNIFGDASEDTHQFNGSITASADISGSSTSTGSFGLAQIDGKNMDTNGVSRDQVLKFNGTHFVPADYDATFEFTIADFDMDHTSTPVLISTGSWKAIGALTFTVSYNNGPPDGYNGSAEGAPQIRGYVDGSVSSSYDMYPLSSSFTTGTNTMAITYPPNSTDDIRFRLYASAGSDTDNDYTDQRIYFYNQFVYGDLSANNGFTQANIRTLAAANTATSNDTSRTLTVSVGSSNYLCFAHRTGDTNVAQVQCGTGNNILTVAMDRTDATTITPLKETVSYLNTAGYTENFYVYASKLANVDAHSTTFNTLTSTVKKNYFYWGYDTQADTYNESFLETAGSWDSHNANSSYDDGTVAGQTLSVGTFTSKYVIIAFPDRYGDNDMEFAFKDNSTGLPFDVTKQSDVTITNAVGFQETYHVWRSTNLLTMTNLTVLIDSV